MNAKKADAGTTTQVSARVPVEVAEYLQRIARDDDRSLSWVVAMALKQWVEARRDGK